MKPNNPLAMSEPATSTLHWLRFTAAIGGTAVMSLIA
jgi:hypothetical protein